MWNNSNEKYQSYQTGNLPPRYLTEVDVTNFLELFRKQVVSRKRLFRINQSTINLRIAERSCIRVVMERECGFRAYSFRLLIEYVWWARENFGRTGFFYHQFEAIYIYMCVCESRRCRMLRFDTLGSRIDNNIKNRMYALGRCKNSEAGKINDS